MGLAYHDPESLRVCLAIIELNRVTRNRQLTPRACRQCGVEFTPAFKDQRRCRNCIDSEPSFKRSQASSDGGTNGKEQRKDAEDWLEWAQAKYDAAQERFAWSDRSDSPTMDSYSTLISLIESGMASRAKNEADAQKKRTAVEQMTEPLMELAEQMETLGRNGMTFSQKAMIDAAQTIKSVLRR